MVRPAAIPALVVAVLAAALLAASAAGRAGVGAKREQAPAPAQVPVAAAPRQDPAPVETLPQPAERSAPRHAGPRDFRVLEVRSGRTVKLRRKPGGPTVARVGSTTEFGSRTVLSVARRRGKWLGVVSSDLPNGRLGWVREGDAAVRSAATGPVSISVDLSERSLELRKGRSVLRRVTVAVGRPGSSTPTGRFAVTDKL